MLEEYRFHNLFKESIDRYKKEDPQLSALAEIPLVYPLHGLEKIDWQSAGIYILTGGRQIGKSTSTKRLILETLQSKKFLPSAIFYLPADQIIDHLHLTRVIRFFLESLPHDRSPFLLVLDEITFVKEWDRSIKALADEGWFRRGFCILTGSDSVILKEAAVRFPGRRGRADQVDFHICPLSFRQYVQLVDPNLLKNSSSNIEDLFLAFSNYLQCGGYLRAINDLHSKGQINVSTYATFEQWIRGDFIKRGKNEANLLSVLQALIEIGVSQTSYSNLHRHSHLSKESFIDYCALLQRMDILFYLEAFDQNKKRGFPKKAKKFHFADPFIRNTLEQWLIRERLLKEPSPESVRVEACAAGQFHSDFPLYYLKGEGEIDLIVVLGKNFLPLEIKWSNQLRPKDLAQLKKYPHSILLTKQTEQGQIENLRIYPLPLFLVLYDSSDKLISLFSKNIPFIS